MKQGEAGKSLDRILRLEIGLYLGLASFAYFSNIICRRCSDKNIILLKRIESTLETVPIIKQDLVKKERGEPAFSTMRSRSTPMQVASNKYGAISKQCLARTRR